jgi:hypothetical protein
LPKKNEPPPRDADHEFNHGTRTSFEYGPRKAKPNGFDAEPPPRDPDDPGPDPPPRQGGGTTAEAAEAVVPYKLTNWNPWDRSGGTVFPMDTLPPAAADWVEAKAMLTGGDPSAFAMALLHAVSGCIDHRVRLQPKQHEPDFLITPAMWLMLIGPPSTLKSAVVRTVTQTLRRFDNRDKLVRADAIRRAKQENPEEDAEQLTPPARRRLLIDPTVEAVAEILSQQKCGITLVRDELAGWLNNMDRYNKGSDRPFWLQALEGGYYSADRISAKIKRDIEMLSIGVCGGIQPDKLKDMPGLTADGLFQRFIPVCMQHARDERDDPVDPKVQEWFNRLTEDVGSIPIQTFALDPEASALYLKFSNDMRHAGRTVIPNEAFGTFLVKQPRTLAVLTLLLHVIDISVGYDIDYPPIPATTLLRAQKIVEQFILPHAEIFYGSSAFGSGLDQVLSIAGAVIKMADEGTEEATARELGRRSRAIRELASDIGKIRQMLTPFVCNGWLTPHTLLPTNTLWTIHPELAGRFKAEIAQQTKIHAEMRERLGSKSHDPDE